MSTEFEQFLKMPLFQCKSDVKEVYYPTEFSVKNSVSTKSRFANHLKEFRNEFFRSSIHRKIVSLRVDCFEFDFHP